MNDYAIGGFRNGIADYMSIDAKTEEQALIKAGRLFRAWARDIKRDVPTLDVPAIDDKFEIAEINGEEVSPKRYYAYHGKNIYKPTDWREKE